VIGFNHTLIIIRYL